MGTISFVCTVAISSWTSLVISAMPLAVLVLPLLTNPVMNAFSNYSKIMAEPHFGVGVAEPHTPKMQTPL